MVLLEVLPSGFTNIKGNYLPLQPGYDARQLIYCNNKSYEVSCKITRGLYFTPVFQCELFLNGDLLYTCNESKPTTAMRNVFNHLKLEYTRNISGFEFWGLQQPHVIQQLQEAQMSKKRKSLEH